MKTACMLLVVMVATDGCEIRRRPPEAGVDAMPADTAAASAAAVRAAGVPDQVTHIHVSLMEWLLILDAESADAGTISFSVTNSGQYEHALHIEPAGWQGERLWPGESTFVELQLDPGTYYLSCPLEDEHGAHQQLGERVTLVIR
jgi:hypothetical protein